MNSKYAYSFFENQMVQPEKLQHLEISNDDYIVIHNGVCLPCKKNEDSPLFGMGGYWTKN